MEFDIKMLVMVTIGGTIFNNWIKAHMLNKNKWANDKDWLRIKYINCSVIRFFSRLYYEIIFYNAQNYFNNHWTNGCIIYRDNVE